LYVEFGKTLRDGYLSRLVSIAKKFSNCIPVMKTGGDTLIIDKDNYKKDMICRMFRAHVVDIRKDLLKKDDPKTLFHFHKIILGVTNGLKPYDPTKTTNEDFIKNINVMKDRYRKEFVLFSTKLDFKLDSKVDFAYYCTTQIKGYEPLMNKTVKGTNNIVAQILDYMEIETFCIAYNFFDKLNSSRILLETSDDDDFTDIKDAILYSRILLQFKNCLINIHAPVLDTYLLSRIFKTFDITTETKQRVFDEPANPSNIIIYVGDFHALRCRRFLEFIGFIGVEQGTNIIEKEEGEKRTMKNCVDSTNITMPLFSFIPDSTNKNPHFKNTKYPMGFGNGLKELKRLKTFNPDMIKKLSVHIEKLECKDPNGDGCNFDEESTSEVVNNRYHKKYRKRQLPDLMTS
jgi:hypothetical protein